MLKVIVWLVVQKGGERECWTNVDAIQGEIAKSVNGMNWPKSVIPPLRQNKIPALNLDLDLDLVDKKHHLDKTRHTSWS